MTNKALARGCALLQDKNIKDEATFWRRFGIQDYVNWTRESLLRDAPVLAELKANVERVLERRNRKQIEIDLGNGEVVYREPPEPKKPEPLREYVLVEHDTAWERPLTGKVRAWKSVRRPTGIMRHYRLHPTRGWKHNRVDISEAKYIVETRKVSARNERLELIKLP